MNSASHRIRQRQIVKCSCSANNDVVWNEGARSNVKMPKNCVNWFLDVTHTSVMDAIQLFMSSDAID